MNLKSEGDRSESSSFQRQEKVEPYVRRIFDDGLNKAVSLFSSDTFFKIWR